MAVAVEDFPVPPVDMFFVVNGEQRRSRAGDPGLLEPGLQRLVFQNSLPVEQDVDTHHPWVVLENREHEHGNVFRVVRAIGLRHQMIIIVHRRGGVEMVKNRWFKYHS